MLGIHLMQLHGTTSYKKNSYLVSMLRKRFVCAHFVYVCKETRF